MNVGEKICLYKERLGYKDFQQFGNAMGVSGNWILELSKRSEIKMVDMGNLVKLCDGLNITIDQLVRDEEVKIEKIESLNSSDICGMMKEIISALNEEDVRLDGVKLNDKAKEILKDSLEVSLTLTRQYL